MLTSLSFDKVEAELDEAKQKIKKLMKIKHEETSSFE